MLGVASGPNKMRDNKVIVMAHAQGAIRSEWDRQSRQSSAEDKVNGVAYQSSISSGGSLSQNSGTIQKT